MIANVEIVALGLNGGKDSTIPLNALEDYRIKSRKRFKLIVSTSISVLQEKKIHR